MRLARTAATLAVLALLGAQSAAAQAPRPAARTPHRTLNKENCLGCHGVGANEHVKAVSSTHSNRANAACARCHRPQTAMPSRSQHAFDGAHARCAVCHVAGNPVHAQPIPADHAGRHATTCVMCHEPQAAP